MFIGNVISSGLGQAPADRYHTITELAYNAQNEDEVLVGMVDRFDFMYS